MKKGLKKGNTRHLVENADAKLTFCGRPIGKVLLWAKKGTPKPEDGTVCNRCKALKAGKARTTKIAAKHERIRKAGAKPKKGTPGLLSGDHWPDAVKKETTAMVAEALEGAAKVVKSAGKRTPALAVLGEKMPRVIYGKYKGLLFTARVDDDGKIYIENDLTPYTSPSGAAMHITEKKPVDGWTFWKYEKEDGTRESINFLRPTESQFIPKAKA